MAQHQRPGLPHTFSQQLNLYRESGDERRPLLSSSTFPRPSTGGHSFTRSNTNPNGSGTALNAIPSIVLNDSDDDYDEDEEHADSDGLYPPHCCYTAADPQPQGQRNRADAFGTKECKVYLNVHR